MSRHILRRRYGRSEATRDYEYVVYPSTIVQGEGVRVPGFGEAGFQAAKRFAKERHGSGIYSVSKGRFVGWINFNGRLVPIGYGR
jgi:hypothetical protein